ncbi:MAG TPA: hypothetical protein VNS63_23935 [Blastocatellia bacterium]|nr:hypothetical protein [Blastocatellia bacterium]
MISFATKRVLLLITSVIIAVTLLLPASGSAQGRGHGWGQGKKSAKFVNGHDARDGRWDRGGPRRGVWRGGWYYVPDRRHRGWVRVRHGRVYRVYVR